MPKVFQVKVALIAALFMVMGMSAATAMDNRAQAALLTKHAQAEAGGQAAAKPAAVEAAPEPAEPEPEPEAEAQPELEETPAPAAEEPVEEVAVEGEEEEAAAPPPPPKDKTPRKVARASIDLLQHGGSHIAGAVLQQVDLKRYGRYGYGDSGYYYHYGRYYNYYSG